MKYIRTTIDINTCEVQIPLGQPCNCYIGLVDITIPNFNENKYTENSVDIFCDQIDSTIYNPKRLLNRIPFEKIHKRTIYNHSSPKHILMEKVDSDDDFLSLKISRTNFTRTGKLEAAFREHTTIYITLALQKENSPRWNCI